ncbi:hypothetical protein [Halobacterium bonnevillei]|uniref:Uncharacterized protein n=1 Tax=Halobacterium bonnevillei TaxID=2692200 RepID=A0A6B0SI87_9EURY|nr:hypothetical protein [Halobacterium bonnevillei]MXR21484.1 hypothetical protein [Halobacterium bonnevillei]
MPTLTRRDAVRGGVLSLAALAGCATGGDSNSGAGGDQPRLDRVRVSNRVSRAVSLDLQLELDGEVVFWDDIEMPAAGEDDEVEGAEFAPPDFPRERGDWRIRTRDRDTDETYTTQFTSETTAESCLDLGINVREDGIEITYVATHDCEDVTTTQQTES